MNTESRGGNWTLLYWVWLGGSVSLYTLSLTSGKQLLSPSRPSRTCRSPWRGRCRNCCFSAIITLLPFQAVATVHTDFILYYNPQASIRSCVFSEMCWNICFSNVYCNIKKHIQFCMLCMSSKVKLNYLNWGLKQPANTMFFILLFWCSSKLPSWAHGAKSQEVRRTVNYYLWKISLYS